MDYVALGKTVRFHRSQMQLNQDELSRKVGVSASFMGHIERGTRIASLETFVNLCKALDLTPNQLLAHEFEPAGLTDLPEQVTISTANLLSGVIQILQNAARLCEYDEIPCEDEAE